MTIARELKRGSAELMILALVEERSRHGYEILKLLEERSDGQVKLHIGSVYPILYRLERSGWIEGEQKVEARRRRAYRITSEGRLVLECQRGAWRDMVAAIARVAGIGHA
jgi:DNA-binding PadR family transcriptional regulator